jgi:hypothetical protein
MAYQYTTSMPGGAHRGESESDDERPDMIRLPSCDSDEDIDPVEYEKQARERQKALLDQAETQRKCWQNWKPEDVPPGERKKKKRLVRHDSSLKAREGEAKGDDADYESDNSFDESKRGDELYLQFRNYSLSGYMDEKRFITLCYDSFLIPYDMTVPDFALADAKKVFVDTLQLYFCPVRKVIMDPIVNTCIPYDVFLEKLIPLVATKKDISIHDLMNMLKNTVAGNRRYWSESDGPKVLLVERKLLGDHQSGSDEEVKEGEMGGKRESSRVETTARGASVRK